jgi:hypothetical protein
MPCGHLPYLVHVRMAVYPSTRCAACDRRLTASDQASVGTFPLVTPEHLVLLRARVCGPCLAEPTLRLPAGMRCVALAIARHLGDWYAAQSPQASSAHSRGSPRRASC